MQRLFAAVLAVTCVVESTPSFARGGAAHGSAMAALVQNPTSLLGAPAPQMPAIEDRIPTPLPPPAQAPTINGPLSQPALRGL